MTDLRAIKLTCEYFPNPLGLETARPRLSWLLESAVRAQKQTAYQICAASSVDKLAAGDSDVWDGRRIESDQSVLISYGGPELKLGQRVWWNVKVWDKDGQESPVSETAYWEMGLLQRTDWQGQWIGAALVGGTRTTIPAPYLRTEFMIEKPIESARLYATALGLYEASLNGERIGSDVFAPGWTEYSKRVPYQTYDVTGLLTQGANALGAILGDGWYCGFVGWRDRQVYGDRPKFLAQLAVTFTDGTTQTIVTDKNWRVGFGPILEADLLQGESYDARRELGAWDSAGYDDTGWGTALQFDDPGIAISAMRGPSVRRQEELTPIADPIPKGDRRWIFDLGQNMVGRVRLRVSGKAGTTVHLRHVEVLDANGEPYTDNLRTAKQTDYYTLKGGELETYEPHFTFHGFRYVELTGYIDPPTRETITGIVLHSDTPPTGEFHCSDPLLNQLQHNIQWGQKGNFLEVPTDCPQRDERLGWTGDAQVFIRTATHNANVAPFFTKWMQDARDSQSDRGAFPPVIPHVDLMPDGGPAWADAGILCPWTVYTVYGDTQILSEHYEAMTRFLAYLERTSQNHIRCYEGYPDFKGFGDWLALDGSGKTDGATSRALIGTAFFAYDARLMARIAHVLGKPDDVRKYEALAEIARKAFLREFVGTDGIVKGDTQTGYVLALHFDLLPEAQREPNVEALVRDIESRGMHLSTGFVGTPYLAHVLTRAGRLDIAYGLLLQKSWPSWLYSVTQGATTIWERWDGWTEENGFQDKGMNSFNHYAYGAIGEWLYRSVAGIDCDPAHPGWGHFFVHPHPGGDLTQARAEYQSVRGKIISGWHLDGGAFVLDVTVPVNTSATVHLPAHHTATITESGTPLMEAKGVHLLTREPAYAVLHVGSGTYQFRAG